MIDDLVSRGHRYQDVVDGYPVGLVLNLHKAARQNRRTQSLDLAVGVSLGIRDAFSQEGPLINAWLEETREQSGPETRQDSLQPFLQGLPVLKKRRERL